jgi:ketosteroid isomerase-like protein
MRSTLCDEVSGQDIEVVRAMFAAWVNGDVDGMLEHVADDVIWHPSIWSSGGVSYHGRAGVREWAAQFGQPGRGIEIRPTEFREGPAAVAVIGDVREYRGHLRSASVTVGWVFEAAGGKVVRGEGFSEPVHAPRIAGIWD